MATIAIKADGKLARGVHQYSWIALGNADVGAPLSELHGGPVFSDKTVSITGTFGAVTVVIQGSNDKTNWFTLSDAQGNALSFTVAGMEVILENPRYIRPSTSGGTATDVDVIIVGRGIIQLK